MSSTRDKLVQDLLLQFRYTSANSVMFSQAVSDRVGLHSTDTECLDYLILHGPSTAGQLSKLTGLTTGAITAVIDRLERGGFVKREADKDDRRKVIIVPNEQKIGADLAPYYASIEKASLDLYTEFSDEELALFLKFLVKINDLGVAETQKLRQK